MASASFREQMNSLGWSRREAEAPVNTSPPSVLGRLQNLNPFGAGGYVRLPITETNPGAPLPAPSRREEEEGWFARKFILLHRSAMSTHFLAPFRAAICCFLQIGDCLDVIFLSVPLQVASGLVMSSEDTPRSESSFTCTAMNPYTSRISTHGIL